MGGAQVGRPTPPSKRRPHFKTCTYLGEKKILVMDFRRLKPGMTVLAKAFSNITDQPTYQS
jgi:hypothetical protein